MPHETPDFDRAHGLSRPARFMAFVVALAVLSLPLPASAGNDDEEPKDPARARLVTRPDLESAYRGASVWVGVEITIEPKWHVYWHSPRDGGLATQVDWKLPEGVTAGPLRWPVPERFVEPGDLISYGYSKKVVLQCAISVPRDFARDRLDIEAEVSWLVCNEYCLPGEAKLSLVVPVVDLPAPPSSEGPESRPQGRSGSRALSAPGVEIRTDREYPSEYSESGGAPLETRWKKLSEDRGEWVVTLAVSDLTGPENVVAFPFDPKFGRLSESKPEELESDGQRALRWTFDVEIGSERFDPKDLAVLIHYTESVIRISPREAGDETGLDKFSARRLPFPRGSGRSIVVRYRDEAKPDSPNK